MEGISPLRCERMGERAFYAQPSDDPTTLAHVHFTTHLHRFFPGLADGEVPGGTVAELVENLEARHAGISRYLTDERGTLRPHVHIFVREEMVLDRKSLSDPVSPDDRVHILQALSGG